MGACKILFRITASFEKFSFENVVPRRESPVWYHPAPLQKPLPRDILWPHPLSQPWTTPWESSCKEWCWSIRESWWTYDPDQAPSLRAWGWCSGHRGWSGGASPGQRCSDCRQCSCRTAGCHHGRNSVLLDDLLGLDVAPDKADDSSHQECFLTWWMQNSWLGDFRSYHLDHQRLVMMWCWTVMVHQSWSRIHDVAGGAMLRYRRLGCLGPWTPSSCKSLPTPAPRCWATGRWLSRSE